MLLAVFGASVLASGGAAVFRLRKSITPALLFCFGVAAAMFSSNAKLMGFPISPDRIFFAAAFGLLFVQSPKALRRIGFFQIHYLLVAVLAVATISALIVGTAFNNLGLFALLDRLGLVPFAAFIFAPVLFDTHNKRQQLLVTVALMGVYLGITAIFEETKTWGLVFPAYISNPNVGIHFGRARGPFLESTADGDVLMLGALACGVLAFQRRWLSTRLIVGAAAMLCMLGAFLTLTRSVWIAAVVAPIVALSFRKETRRIVIPLVAVGAAVAIVALISIPGLSGNASDRKSQQSPIWDRYNTNAAAIRAIDDRPLFGIGFAHFIDVSPKYLRQGPTYPLTGLNLEVHNVFLGRFAELGILGGSLWLVTFATCVGAAILRKPPPELIPWRQFLAGYVTVWLIVSMLAPNSSSLPNLALWTLAGILYGAKTAPEPPAEVELDLREPLLIASS